MSEFQSQRQPSIFNSTFVCLMEGDHHGHVHLTRCPTAGQTGKGSHTYWCHNSSRFLPYGQESACALVCCPTSGRTGKVSCTHWCHKLAPSWPGHLYIPIPLSPSPSLRVSTLQSSPPLLIWTEVTSPLSLALSLSLCTCECAGLHFGMDFCPCSAKQSQCSLSLPTTS